MSAQESQTVETGAVPDASAGFSGPSSTADHFPSSRWKQQCKNALAAVCRHAKSHVGAGIVCSVAYFDPGNWGVDLLAGSNFGNKMLCAVLFAGILAVYFQVLSSRLGCVTGRDLASHCRQLLYSRPKHTLLYRYLGLYPLYVLSEVAIISTDLAELLGSAIALCMLFPSLQLWHGVLITAFDVVILLAIKDPLGGRPARMFEAIVAILVLAVLICICIIIAKLNVQWPQVFVGFLPSKEIFQADGLYTAVGILGATNMPHIFFLGSALATQDRENCDPDSEKAESWSLDLRKPSLPWYKRIGKFISIAFRRPSENSSARGRHDSDRSNNSLEFVRAHLSNATVDICASLLGIAVLINSAILILASTVFYSSEHQESSASLFDAYDVIRDLVGSAAATLFAIALLAAGQSSSIIATVAGQAVSEGFLNWRMSPVMRRLITRLFAVIPSMLVAIIVGRRGIDSLLVISQVILCIVLPFITLPLILLTASKSVMYVTDAEGLNGTDFSNHIVVTVVGLALWLLVLVANFYVIVTLALGHG